MIAGIGIDIIEIERIKKAIDKNDRFLIKLFTKNEIEMFNEKGMRAETVAGNFAAKEAVSKVLGRGISGFKWTDIEVLRDFHGKPYAKLHGEAYRISLELNIHKIEVSISHDKTSAIANAIGFY